MLNSRSLHLSLVSTSGLRRHAKGGAVRLLQTLHTAYLDWRIQSISKDLEALECDLLEIPEIVKLYRRTQTEMLIRKATIARP